MHAKSQCRFESTRIDSILLAQLPVRKVRHSDTVLPCVLQWPGSPCPGTKLFANGFFRNSSVVGSPSEEQYYNGNNINDKIIIARVYSYRVTFTTNEYTRTDMNENSTASGQNSSERARPHGCDLWPRVTRADQWASRWGSDPSGLSARARAYTRMMCVRRAGSYMFISLLMQTTRTGTHSKTPGPGGVEANTAAAAAGVSHLSPLLRAKRCFPFGAAAGQRRRIYYNVAVYIYKNINNNKHVYEYELVGRTGSATRFIVIIIIIYSPSNNNTYNRAAQNWTRK